METHCPLCGMINSVVLYPTCGSNTPNQDCPWHLPTRFTNIENNKTAKMGKTTEPGIEYIICIKYRLLDDSKIVTEDYILYDLNNGLDKIGDIIRKVAKVEAIIIIRRDEKGDK